MGFVIVFLVRFTLFVICIYVAIIFKGVSWVDDTGSR